MIATAPPARRFLLLETPGPWAADLVDAAGLEPGPYARVSRAVAAVGARLLLVRRPGAHPAEPGIRRRWATAEVGRGLSWAPQEQDLFTTDLGAWFATAPTASTGEARPIALVCTQGRHDLCCAVEGRPVAEAAAADPRIDTWECSHLGGDRFAANLLWLPGGHLFGGLGPDDVPGLIDAAVEGRVPLEHYRGRCGDSPQAQAALWYLLQELGERDPSAVVVDAPPTAGPDAPFTVSGVHAGRRHEVTLAWSWSPANRLTCRAAGESRVRRYRRLG